MHQFRNACIVTSIFWRMNTHLSFFCTFIYLSISIFSAISVSPSLTSPSLSPSPSTSPSPSLSPSSLLSQFPSISQKTIIIQNRGEQFTVFYLFTGTSPKKLKLCFTWQKWKYIEFRMHAPIYETHEIFLSAYISIYSGKAVCVYRYDNVWK